MRILVNFELRPRKKEFRLIIVPVEKVMIERIKDRISDRRECARMVEIAGDAFRAKYPDRYMVEWKISPQHLPSGDYIVTVCWSNTRPPYRTWWRIAAGTEKVTELSRDEAEDLIDIPVWR